MPILACRTCGRVVYATSALDTLVAEECRCPRCGDQLSYERRADNRRKVERRNGPAADAAPSDGIERRVADRRQVRRRREDAKPQSIAGA